MVVLVNCLLRSRSLWHCPATALQRVVTIVSVLFLPARFIWRAEQSNWDAKNLPTGLIQHAVCTHNAKTIHAAAIMPTRVCPRRVACSATAMCRRTITLTHLHRPLQIAVS